MNHIAEKYSYTREKSSIGVFVAALVGVGPTMMLSKSIVLTAWRQGIISSIVTCHPRSSRRTTGYYTDFRRLSIRGTTEKLDPLHSGNVLLGRFDLLDGATGGIRNHVSYRYDETNFKFVRL